MAPTSSTTRTISYNTMAHLTKTPTDIMAQIVDLLDSHDIRKLRQTCRWAESQTFKSFATHGFGRVDLHCRYESDYRQRKRVEDFEQVMQGSESVASYVEFLFVDCEGPARYQTTLSRLLPLLTHVTGCWFPFLTSADLSGGLKPWFQQILLQQCQVGQHLQGGTWSRLTRLSLARCRLQSSEIISLLGATSPTIKELKLFAITSCDHH